MKRALILAILVAGSSATATAQSSRISQAIAAGRVGERFDGYLGFAVAPSDELRRQVTSVNIQRRNLYIELAAQRNVTAQLVGLTTACTLFRQLAPGEAYMLKDQVWRHHVEGQPASAGDSCGAN